MTAAASFLRSGRLGGPVLAASLLACGGGSGFEREVVGPAEEGRFEEVLEAFRRAKDEGRLPADWRELEPYDRESDPRPLNPANLPSISPESLVILEPLGTVRTTRPRIRWHDPRGPRKYRVSISTRAGPRLQLESDTPEIAYPSHEPALEPLGSYWLQVHADEDFRTSGNADFGVSFRPQAQETEERLKALQSRLGEGPAFSFFAGSLLRNQKFRLEAASHLESLLETFPDSRHLHQTLARIYSDLGNLYDLRRVLEFLGRGPGEGPSDDR